MVIESVTAVTSQLWLALDDILAASKGELEILMSELTVVVRLRVLEVQ